MKPMSYTLQFQQDISFYHILKDKYSHTQSILNLFENSIKLGVYWDVIRCDMIYWILI